MNTHSAQQHTSGSSMDPTLQQRMAEHRNGLLAKMGAHLGRVTWDRATIEAFQTEQLRTMLSTAIEKSPFHRRRLAGIDPSTFTLADLPTLPVMTKEEMMAEFDDVLTDRRLSLAAVEAHLSTVGDWPSYLLDEYIVLTSGGSSGVRGVYVMGWDATIDYGIANVRLGVALPPPGERPNRRPGPARHTMLAAGKGYHGTRAISTLFMPAVGELQSLAVTTPLAELVEALNAFQPDRVNAYPSTMLSLAAEQRAGRLHIEPQRITLWAEPFSDATRAAISTAFGATIVNGFGSSEGLLGMSTDDGTSLRLAEDLAIVELVDAENNPVPRGTPSAHVLVTNLHNPVQPLIRYRIDDVMIEVPGDGQSGYRHVTVQGRNNEPFRYGALTVHPITFESALERVPQITEYQVRQTRDGASVSVVAMGAIDADAVAASLVGELAAQGVDQPVVDVVVVGGLARNPGTGKVARFVPL